MKKVSNKTMMDVSMWTAMKIGFGVFLAQTIFMLMYGFVALALPYLIAYLLG